jgi:hypothetical protein
LGQENADTNQSEKRISVRQSVPWFGTKLITPSYTTSAGGPTEPAQRIAAWRGGSYIAVASFVVERKPVPESLFLTATS